MMKHLWLPLLPTFHIFLLLTSYFLVLTSFFLPHFAYFLLILMTYTNTYSPPPLCVCKLLGIVNPVMSKGEPLHRGFESRVSCKYPRIAAKTVSVRSSKDGTCLRLHARHAHTGYLHATQCRAASTSLCNYHVVRIYLTPTIACYMMDECRF